MAAGGRHAPEHRQHRGPADARIKASTSALLWRRWWWRAQGPVHRPAGSTRRATPTFAWTASSRPWQAPGCAWTAGQGARASSCPWGDPSCARERRAASCCLCPRARQGRGACNSRMDGLARPQLAGRQLDAAPGQSEGVQHERASPQPAASACPSSIRACSATMPPTAGAQLRGHGAAHPEQRKALTRPARTARKSAPEQSFKDEDRGRGPDDAVAPPWRPPEPDRAQFREQARHVQRSALSVHQARRWACS